MFLPAQNQFNKRKVTFHTPKGKWTINEVGRASDRRRTGTASGSPVSVRAFGFIMVGHIRHHAKYLRERYF